MFVDAVQETEHLQICINKIKNTEKNSKNKNKSKKIQNTGLHILSLYFSITRKMVFYLHFAIIWTFEASHSKRALFFVLLMPHCFTLISIVRVWTFVLQPWGSFENWKLSPLSTPVSLISLIAVPMCAFAW